MAENCDFPSQSTSFTEPANKIPSTQSTFTSLRSPFSAHASDSFVGRTRSFAASGSAGLSREGEEAHPEPETVAPVTAAVSATAVAADTDTTPNDKHYLYILQGIDFQAVSQAPIPEYQIINERNLLWQQYLLQCLEEQQLSPPLRNYVWSYYNWLHSEQFVGDCLKIAIQAAGEVYDEIQKRPEQSILLQQLSFALATNFTYNPALLLSADESSSGTGNRNDDGKEQELLDKFLECLPENDPYRDAWGHEFRARMKCERKQHQEAIEHFQKALKIIFLPNDQPAPGVDMAKVADLYWKMGMAYEALAMQTYSLVSYFYLLNIMQITNTRLGRSHHYDRTSDLAESSDGPFVTNLELF